jgi:hypothetical protein
MNTAQMKRAIRTPDINEHGEKKKKRNRYKSSARLPGHYYQAPARRRHRDESIHHKPIHYSDEIYSKPRTHHKTSRENGERKHRHHNREERKSHREERKSHGVDSSSTYHKKRHRHHENKESQDKKRAQQHKQSRHHATSAE